MTESRTVLVIAYSEQTCDWYLSAGAPLPLRQQLLVAGGANGVKEKDCGKIRTKGILIKYDIALLLLRRTY